MKWASWDFQVRTLSGASAGSEAAVTGNLMAALTGISGVALTRSLNPRQLGKGAVAMSETSHAFVTQISGIRMPVAGTSGAAVKGACRDLDRDSIIKNMIRRMQYPINLT